LILETYGPEDSILARKTCEQAPCRSCRGNHL